MAGPRTRRSLRRNPSPTGEDELARAPTKCSGTSTPTPIISHASTPALASALVPAPGAMPAPAAVPAPAARPAPTDEMFKQFMKTYLEAQTQPALGLSEPGERPLKALFPNLYHGNSHQDCYCFCQQCKDHFETPGAKGANHIPFAASFLYGLVVQRWLQHKRRADGVRPMTWVKFKGFLCKNLGDS